MNNSNKVKIKIGIIGYLPFDFNIKMIKQWKSDIFKIIGDIEEYSIHGNSNTSSWGYSDDVMEKKLPTDYGADFFIGITYVPIEGNYYARRLSSNRIVLSYFEMYQILKQENIPMENLLLRSLYAYTLVYLRNSHKIPVQNSEVHFTHDDTRGCLFDMNGNKSDVIYSLNSPQICPECTEKIRRDMVSNNVISKIKEEIKKIKKKHFNKTREFIKKKPIVSMIISATFGILLNLIAAIVFEYVIKKGSIF